MKENLFFKPTPIYKEYLILDIIEKNPKITQRELSDLIGASASMINTYIDTYEDNGLVKRKYITNKVVEYHITKSGIERKRLLNISYLKASHDIFTFAKENILLFLIKIIGKGYVKLLLYGAGEVAELLLLVLNDKELFPINVLAIIDDDVKKNGSYLLNYPIISKEQISEYEHDGILISSYNNRTKIYNNLLNYGYEKEKVITFFEI